MAKAKAKSKAKKGRQAKTSKGKKKAGAKKSRKVAPRRRTATRRTAASRTKVSESIPSTVTDTTPEVPSYGTASVQDQSMAGEPGAEETSYSEIGETESSSSSM